MYVLIPPQTDNKQFTDWHWSNQMHNALKHSFDIEHIQPSLFNGWFLSCHDNRKVTAKWAQALSYFSVNAPPQTVRCGDD